MQNALTSRDQRAFGSTMLLIAAAVSLAAGIFFLAVRGTFGLDSTHNGDCYNFLIVVLLCGGAAVAAVMWLTRHEGIGAGVLTGAVIASVCIFIHECYWYIVDVFVGIDEKHGFDPKFIVFTALLVLALIAAEVAVYTRKTRIVK